MIQGSIRNDSVTVETVWDGLSHLTPTNHLATVVLRRPIAASARGLIAR